MRGLAFMVGLASLGACSDGNRVELLDTGWFDDAEVSLDTDAATACLGRVVDVEPADGEADWFWRDSPTVFVEQVADDYAVRLTDALGRPVPVVLEPVDDVGLKLAARFEGGLAPSTEYLLEVDDCFETRSISFTTSAYGTPVTDGTASLIGRTYQLDLAGAEWIEPGGFGPILATNFVTPVLLGVAYADDEYMDWIGATGFASGGRIFQDDDYPTWEFPVSPFGSSPFFETSADSVTLVVSGYELPISDFVLSGTLAADASHFAGGTLRGIGDTRLAGGALGQPNNPNAMCTLAAGIGVPCIECEDGEPLCLAVHLESMIGTQLPGLTLEPVLAER